MVAKCRIVIVLLLTLVVNLHAKASSVNIQDSLRISLLTCSPGDEIYNSYGHSAIRVQDMHNGFDVVFNYGTFDFGTPFFVPKFLRGTLDYMLSASNFQRFIATYQREQRGVVEREFILSTSQKEEMEQFLFFNLQPENRFYRYDFFFDNCATRIRDIAFRITNKDSQKSKKLSDTETFRDCLHYFVTQNEWYGAGIDLILGVRTDKYISAYDKAMLPDFLEELLVNENLVGEPHVILERANSAKPTSPLATPISISVIMSIVILALTVYEVKKGIWLKWVDYILFVVMSLLALLFWFLWVISEIKITTYNVNVLWASILYIPLIIGMLRRQITIVKRLAIVNIVLLFIYSVVSICGVQFAPSIAIASAFCLTLRNVAIVYRSRSIK